MEKDFKENNLFISADKSKLNLEVIHGFLKTSYWAKDIPFSMVQKSIENSLCFGVYTDENQIGFARVITDYAAFAYLADVFILENYRGKGIGKHLLKTILEHSNLQGIRKWFLVTKDAHGLYNRYGFNNLEKPEVVMAKFDFNCW